MEEFDLEDDIPAPVPFRDDDGVPETEDIRIQRVNLLRAYCSRLSECNPRATIEKFIFDKGWCPCCELGIVGMVGTRFQRGTTYFNPTPSGLRGFEFNNHFRKHHPAEYSMIKDGRMPELQSHFSESFGSRLTPGVLEAWVSMMEEMMELPSGPFELAEDDMRDMMAQFYS
jgi:hypothetical protein